MPETRGEIFSNPFEYDTDTRSGVDATIAGDTAYLSHVFGLRAAQNVVSTGMSDGSRTVSTGSGTISSRSASGSSLSVPKSAKYDTSISSTDSSGQKIALIRDPHQNIGIRKGGSREVSPFVDQIEQVQKKVCSRYEASGY